MRNFEGLSKDKMKVDNHIYTDSPEQYISSSPMKIEGVFGSEDVFGKFDSDQLELATEFEVKSNPAKEAFALQEMHLRYLMSSTVEQPDNSGRTSNINIWLTILIAGLAAAILS